MLTREENGNPGSNKNESLANRVKFGQENNADIFVSIHANSSEKHDGHGTETYYYKNPSVEKRHRLKRIVKY